MKYLNGKTKEELMEEAKEFVSKIDSYEEKADKYCKEYGYQVFRLLGITLSGGVAIEILDIALMLFGVPKKATAVLLLTYFITVALALKHFLEDKSHSLEMKEEDKIKYAKELRKYLKAIEKSESLLNNPELKQLESLLPKYDIEQFDTLYEEKTVDKVSNFIDEKYNEVQAIINSGALTAKVNLISDLTDLSEFKNIFINYVDRRLKENESIYNTSKIKTYPTVDEGYQYKKTIKI